MPYRKITATLVVDNDDAEAVIEQLNVALDKLDKLHTVYESSISQAETNTPENAAEIASPAQN